MEQIQPNAERGGLFAAVARFLGDYARYAGWRRSLLGCVLVFLGALFEGLGLALIAPLLGLLFQSGSSQSSLYRRADAVFSAIGITSLTGRLALLMGGFAVLMVLRAIVILARDMTLARLRIGFVEHQRTRTAHALAMTSWAQVTRLRHARVLQVMSSDVQQIGTAALFLTQSLTAMVMLSVQCVLALYFSPPLALLSFVILIVSALALLPTMEKSRHLGKFLTSASQNVLHGISQFLGGLKLAISQNLQTAFVAEFEVTLKAQSDQQLRYQRQQTGIGLVVATFSALVGASLVLVGISVFHVAPALLLALLVVVTRMSGPVRQIQQGGQMLANALPAYDAVLSLNRELASPAPAPGEVKPIPAGDIRFDRVTFEHGSDDGDDGARGVHDLSLTIPRGICLGIKGPSGAGKTTFVDLLVGLYPPQSGTVSIGGEALSERTLSSWRDKISYVVQDPFLFNDTIRRNLSWANPKADEAAMWAALALAEAENFVRHLPDGLDTVVGERGTLVSGGERQRLALARGILRRSDVLVLDEAANAVDPQTEDTIIARLLTLMPKPTLVIIAHRPESLTRCDRILTLEGGRIAADEIIPKS